jgi:NAD(P)-dependent dehydrogenase (short-subunit alcohol dehydrogenase family)
MTRPQARAVLITGCSSGIGLCVAEGLRSRGYRVFATARKEADAQRLNADGFESLKLDLSDPDSIADTLEEILERTGNRLYALFNNGGFGQPGAVEDLSTRVLRAQFEVNFFGWHELTRRVLPVMRAQGEGRIIQNSSVLGFITLKFRGAYNASKFALEGLSDTLRLELRGTNIHVSLIEPGPVISRFRENAYRAFKANVNVEESPHRRAYAALERRLANTESEPPFTLPPSAVLKKVVHAIESSRPRPRYYVTMPTHGFGLLKRLLPTRLLDRLLIAASGAEVRH